MATSGELAAVVADAFGCGEQTAVNQVRRLREAGLIAQRGRGTSAARMASVDAARVVIALAAAPILREVPSVTASFCDLAVEAGRHPPFLPTRTLEQTVAFVLDDLARRSRTHELPPVYSATGSWGRFDPEDAALELSWIDTPRGASALQARYREFFLYEHVYRRRPRLRGRSMRFAGEVHEAANERLPRGGSAVPAIRQAKFVAPATLVRIAVELSGR